ncbi:hypothetical protein TNCV_2628501, partial [Trichonephila clavipes]
GYPFALIHDLKKSDIQIESTIYSQGVLARKNERERCEIKWIATDQSLALCVGSIRVPDSNSLGKSLGYPFALIHDLKKSDIQIESTIYSQGVLARKNERERCEIKWIATDQSLALWVGSIHVPESNPLGKSLGYPFALIHDLKKSDIQIESTIYSQGVLARKNERERCEIKWIATDQSLALWVGSIRVPDSNSLGKSLGYPFALIHDLKKSDIQIESTIYSQGVLARKNERERCEIKWIATDQSLALWVGSIHVPDSNPLGKSLGYPFALIHDLKKSDIQIESTIYSQGVLARKNERERCEIKWIATDQSLALWVGSIHVPESNPLGKSLGYPFALIHDLKKSDIQIESTIYSQGVLARKNERERCEIKWIATDQSLALWVGSIHVPESNSLGKSLGYPFALIHDLKKSDIQIESTIYSQGVLARKNERERCEIKWIATDQSLALWVGSIHVPDSNSLGKSLGYPFALIHDLKKSDIQIESTIYSQGVLARKNERERCEIKWIATDQSLALWVGSIRVPDSNSLGKSLGYPFALIHDLKKSDIQIESTIYSQGVLARKNERERCEIKWIATDQSLALWVGSIRVPDSNSLGKSLGYPFALIHDLKKSDIQIESTIYSQGVLARKNERERCEIKWIATDQSLALWVGSIHVPDSTSWEISGLSIRVDSRLEKSDIQIESTIYSQGVLARKNERERCEIKWIATDQSLALWVGSIRVPDSNSLGKSLGYPFALIHDLKKSDIQIESTIYSQGVLARKNERERCEIKWIATDQSLALWVGSIRVPDSNSLGKSLGYPFALIHDLKKSDIQIESTIYSQGVLARKNERERCEIKWIATDQSLALWVGSIRVPDSNSLGKSLGYPFALIHDLKKSDIQIESTIYSQGVLARKNERERCEIKWIATDQSLALWVGSIRVPDSNSLGKSLGYPFALIHDLKKSDIQIESTIYSQGVLAEEE